MSQTDRRTFAVILAGGSGRRLGQDVPKQFLKVAGKTILQHTLEAFESCREIDAIVVMSAAGWESEVHEIAAKAGISKLLKVATGRDSRDETTAVSVGVVAGLCADGDAKVLIHDAVRPLVDHRIIRECVIALEKFYAVDVAVPTADTIIIVDGDRIVDIPDRRSLRRGQTPQGFRLSLLQATFAAAARDSHFLDRSDEGRGTCGLVNRYLPSVEIHVVDGAEANVKVTYPVDMVLADQLFRLRSETLDPGMRWDVLAGRLKDKVVVVLGGSYGIGAAIGRMAAEAGARVHSHSRTTTGVDVASRSSVAAALADILQREGHIDAVFVTAGSLNRVPLVDMPDDEIDSCVAINLTGAIYSAKESFRYLAEVGGHLVLFTSSSYTRGREGYSVYSATKAAIVNLTQSLADEWASSGVHVNCINPERTRTPMRMKAFGAEPEGSLLEADDVARAAIRTVAVDHTGMIIDVRRSNLE